MRFLLALLLTASLSFLVGLYMPWWSIAVVAFLVALVFNQGPGLSFLAGFLGIFLCWGLVSVWIDLANNSVLSHKIAQLFSLGGSSVLLILVTAFVGALVGGFAAMSGGSLRPVTKASLVK